MIGVPRSLGALALALVVPVVAGAQAPTAAPTVAPLKLEVRQSGLIADLHRPAAEARYPAVIVLGGSGGGISGCQTSVAELLARRGVVALALAYFGMEGLPADLERIPLEYVDHALTWLRLQPYVDENRIGLVGGSKGAELALLYASRRAEIGAVAALVPSGIVFQSTAKGFPMSSSWSHHGRELPFVRYGKVANPPAVADYYRIGLQQATPEELEAATIPVERIHGPILLLSGRADTLWPSSELAERIVARLRAKQFAHPFEHVAYEDAGHLISCVRDDATRWGGTVEAMRRAQLDAQERVLAFIEKALAASGPSP